MRIREIGIVGRLFFLLLAGGFCVAGTAAQSVDSSGKIPNHFGKVYLGMTMEQAKDALKNDANFNFKGDPDISILHRPDEALIECSGTFYIIRAVFQFYKNRLYTILLNLDPHEIDHYSMFTALSRKYGNPETLSPQEAVWRSKEYTLSLERPLSVKYIDNKVLETIRTAGKKAKTLQELSREQFVQQF